MYAIVSIRHYQSSICMDFRLSPRGIRIRISISLRLPEAQAHPNDSIFSFQFQPLYYSVCLILICSIYFWPFAFSSHFVTAQYPLSWSGNYVKAGSVGRE